ncbi:acetyl-CoA carboxylase, biotin carboxyl carrier protein [Thauera aromatica]|uniref:acetyl-CoA carboxylase biotin carboxyl carrier protein n=1 Tax=Thauera aromatica TaxID=59405 RepID=UPI001FFC3FFE|nr:biotin/lipoyl-containing protein [Thauera aromatica]MCK2088413.1 acetyl-CoA carboxylase, biotin carboxyl carrier protein [Thauera aromatica]
MKLTNEDVNEILQLLDAGPFNELNLQTLRFKLQLRRGSDGMWTQEAQILSAPELLSPATAAAAPAASTAHAPAEARHAEKEHLTAVRTPLLGTFYRAPKPGAPAFVEVGSRVGPDTLVGIVETMKLMNSVYAGAAGTVVEICAKDAATVEHGEVLMFIEAEGA